MKKLLFLIAILSFSPLFGQNVVVIPATHQGVPLGVVPENTVATIFKNDSIYCFSSIAQFELKRAIAFPADTLARAKQELIVKIKASRSFGQELIDDFTAENTLLGIAKAKPATAAALITATDPVMKALSSGSLHIAISAIKALPQNAFDGLYLTAERALIFRRKIEAYLGLPLSNNYND